MAAIGKTASLANAEGQNLTKAFRNARLIPDAAQASEPPRPPPFIYDAFALIQSDTGETRTFDGFDSEDLSRSAEVTRHPVSYTHLTLPTNREV